MVMTTSDALAFVQEIYSLPGNDAYLDNIDAGMRQAGIDLAVSRRDTPALFRWLMHGLSYQGISNTVASDYIDRFGNASWHEIGRALAHPGPQCAKLNDFASYRGCRYRKALRQCGNSDDLATCAVPTLPLCKGALNEQAFSLFLFMRDRCNGDVVGFIDAVIASAALSPDPAASGREALLAAFGEIQGVGRKLLSMMLSTLLIGGDRGRSKWIAVGRSMVAIDSLVHNCLHRTGILAAYDAGHPYGLRCIGKRGCEVVIRDLADRLDARSINPLFPSTFPRLVQHAIWRFAAAGELNICNGRNVPAGLACAYTPCPLFAHCSRLPLRPAPAAEVE